MGWRVEAIQGSATLAIAKESLRKLTSALELIPPGESSGGILKIHEFAY